MNCFTIRKKSDPMTHAPALPTIRRRPVTPRSALLVNPFYPKEPTGSFGKHVLTPSLALPSLAAVTPEDWSVRFWDENLLQGPPPLDPMPQVVGITVHLTFAKRAYELAAWFRAHDVIVVMGGPHTLACPEEVARHCDVLALGNGTVTWPAILGDIARGCIKPRYEDKLTDFASEPVPKRDILPSWGFLTPGSLIATRGCHNRCEYCYLATGAHRLPYQMRTPADVALEFAKMKTPYGVFLDNNLGANRAYLRALCRALAPLGKMWSAAVTIDVTDDPDLVREMAQAGCSGVFVGFESLTDANLRHAGKHAPPAADLARRVGIFHQYGVQVNGSFVFGFDGDGADVFAATAQWIEDVGLECATFHILTPYPGTPLFARLESEGRILHHDWTRYDTAHAVFRPAGMSSAELEAGYRWIYRRLFSMRSIWRRRPHQLRAVAPYLAMSWLYKKANPLWRVLIRFRLTHAAWKPLVYLSWRRQKRLQAQRQESPQPAPRLLPAAPGV